MKVGGRKHIHRANKEKLITAWRMKGNSKMEDTAKKSKMIKYK
jgi:hypothetical protein